MKTCVCLFWWSLAVSVCRDVLFMLILAQISGCRMINVVAILAYLIIHINILIFALILKPADDGAGAIFLSNYCQSVLSWPSTTLRHTIKRWHCDTIWSKYETSLVADLSRLFKSVGGGMLHCDVNTIVSSTLYIVRVEIVSTVLSMAGYLVVTLISIDLPSSIFSQVWLIFCPKYNLQAPSHL